MATPSKALLVLEAARGVYEYGLGWLLNVPLQYISPKGDGHPVIVFPGLGTADNSTHYIRNFLGSLGYKTHPWGLGRNLGPRHGLEKLLLDLDTKLLEVSAAHEGQKVSLIGWSLGGIYARELARRNPDAVRQVITLGTPFKGEAHETNATLLYELLSGDKSHRNPDMIKELAMPLSVPFTSIYSKTDGVVSWENSQETGGTCFENIEVPGASHLGLGHNPIAMHIIADRLAQVSGTWKPYRS
jgi:hypothetical protein